jgi:hypothetical protein
MDPDIGAEGRGQVAHPARQGDASPGCVGTIHGEVVLGRDRPDPVEILWRRPEAVGVLLP